MIAVAGTCALLLGLELRPRLRTALVTAALVALFAAPATWAAETIGHATNGTFPTGGPANAANTGGLPSGFGGRGGGSPFGADSQTLTAAVQYAKSHGGGTIGVSSQSSAASAIISSNGDVAGLGGFSGRESSVTVSWLALEVRSGNLRWVLVDDQTQTGRLPGDTRSASQSAIGTVARACRKATFRSRAGTLTTMYDCWGRASAILGAAGE